MNRSRAFPAQSRPTARRRRAWLFAACLATAVACASTPETAAVGPPDEQALIDAFLHAMPRDPRQLRDAAVRESLATSALPAMQQIRAHVAQHHGSPLAERVHEFVIYSLVLDEPGLRSALQAKAAAGERSAEVLLRAADIIRAADANQRSTAVAACTQALRAADPADATIASCAVQCLAVAADLSATEATSLADSGCPAPLAERLRAVAERAARDPRRLVGTQVALAGKQLDGSPFDTASLRGKVVLVDFWATWCVPCVRFLPELVRLQREYGDALAIVGVSSDHDRSRLTEFLATHPEINWPQMFEDGDGSKRWHPLTREHGVESLPTLFLIDRGGILRSIDARSDLDAQVQRYLAR